MVDALKKIYKLFPSQDHYKLVILFGMMIFSALLELLGIGMIPAFVVAVSDPQSILEYPVVGDWLLWAGITTSEELVVAGALVLILVYLVKNIYLGFFLYLKRRFIANRGVRLQRRLFKAYMTAPYSYYINRNSADLLRNVNGEVNRIIEGMVVPFMELSLNLIMFIFIIGGLFIFEPLITLVTFIVLGGGGYVFLRYTRKKTNVYGLKDQSSRGEMNKAVIQGLGGFKATRVLNREQAFLDHFGTYAEENKKAKVYRYVVNNIPKPIIETLAIMGILLIALILVGEGRSVDSIVPILALFGAATVRLMPIFNLVIAKFTDLEYNLPAVTEVFNDLNNLENRSDSEFEYDLSAEEKLKIDNEIQLQSVTFKYAESNEQALKDISLKIPKGNAIAFVGPTGAGKTTLVDIILGLLEPQDGNIKVDGKNIYDDIRKWQRNVGYIPQSIYLIDDTVRRNIAYGIPDEEIDDKKLWDAIEAAQLGELINRLPKREYTVVGERGVRLSGGQRQRVGIARALYNNPEVLIMDEATSSLDNITEKFVIKAIERLRGDRTIIMIAHRLTTVKNCDNIYLLDEGKIIDNGTYSELMENSPEFRKMSMAE